MAAQSDTAPLAAPSRSLETREGMPVTVAYSHDANRSRHASSHSNIVEDASGSRRRVPGGTLKIEGGEEKAASKGWFSWRSKRNGQDMIAGGTAAARKDGQGRDRQVVRLLGTNQDLTGGKGAAFGVAGMLAPSFL
jgi:hypothetical protein